MYSLMIVEDELLARLALKNTISWEKLNVEEIMEACDGLEALHQYREYHPDIMIVDINIPFMNGIELIQKIRKEDLRTRIIILSCLEDFHFAKEAVNSKVSSYILKASMSVKEIENAVRNAVLELDREKAGPLRMQKAEKQEEYRKKSSYLRRLLSGHPCEKEEEGIFFMPSCIAVFRVSFDRQEEKDFNQELLNKMNFVKSIITTTVREEMPCIEVTLPGDLYTVLITCRFQNKETFCRDLTDVLKNVEGRIEKYTRARVRTGISPILSGQSEIREGFLNAKRKLACCSFLDTGITFDTVETLLPLLGEKCRECEGAIREKLRKMDLEAAVTDWPPFSADYITVMQDYWGLLQSRTAVLWERQNRTKPDRLLFDYTDRIRETETLEEGKNIFLSFLDALCKQKGQPGYSQVVEKVLVFTRKNYQNPITLSDAAEAVHVSPSYLSMVFKKEYGVTYTDYLNGTRMELAKALLTAGNEKLADIAGQCGFHDHTYFTRTFKKYVGVPPQEYRKTGRGVEE